MKLKSYAFIFFFDPNQKKIIHDDAKIFRFLVVSKKYFCLFLPCPQTSCLAILIPS